MKGLILALQFLTRIPIPVEIDFNKKNFANSNYFYGIVGIILGGIYASVYNLLFKEDILISSLIITFAMVLFTGGLHLDGLSDMADGFFSGKPPKETYEIMKDSRVGTFGVLGLIFILLSKFVFIFRLSSPWGLFFAASNPRFLLPVFFLISKSPSDKGLAAFEQESVPKSAIIPAIIYAIILLWKSPFNFISFIAVFFWMLILRLWANKKINGVNGDIFGAFVETSELITLVIHSGIIFNSVLSM